MRVVRIITRLNIGGPSIQAMALTERLTSRGFDTLLVHGRLGEGEGDMRYLLGNHGRVESLPTLQRSVAPVDDARALASLVSLLRRFNPNIVHTHMAKAGTIGRTAALLYNCSTGTAHRARVVHTYHGHVLEGYFSRGKTRVFVGVERQLARATDAIIAISPQIQTELLDEHRIGRPEQYRVIPLGFDLTALTGIDDAARGRARRALDIPDGAHVMTTVGRLTAIKQHCLFLETARHVAAADPAAVFLVAGDGELRHELEAGAKAMGIADRVRFLGWRRDLASVYGATDIFLLTSRNEGTPVALIESLAAGVPGVSPEVGGVRDVITNDDIGLMAPFGDAIGLAESVLGLFADPARRRAMGARGRESVVARFGLDRLVGDVEALYRELLS
jgi:glycosyltransferase involved in cell wall biosynthesis